MINYRQNKPKFVENIWYKIDLMTVLYSYYDQAIVG